MNKQKKLLTLPCIFYAHLIGIFFVLLSGQAFGCMENTKPSDSFAMMIKTANDVSFRELRLIYPLVNEYILSSLWLERLNNERAGLINEFIDLAKKLEPASKDTNLPYDAMLLKQRETLGSVEKLKFYVLGKIFSIIRVYSVDEPVNRFCLPFVVKIMLDGTVVERDKQFFVRFLLYNLDLLNIEDLRALMQKGFPLEFFNERCIREILVQGKVEHVEALLKAGMTPEIFLSCNCLRIAPRHLNLVVLNSINPSSFSGSITIEDLMHDVVIAEKCLELGMRLTGDIIARVRSISKTRKVRDVNLLHLLFMERGMELNHAAVTDDYGAVRRLLANNAYSKEQLAEALCYASAQLAVDVVNRLLDAGAKPQPAFAALQGIQSDVILQTYSIDERSDMREIEALLRSRLSIKNRLLYRLTSKD